MSKFLYPVILPLRGTHMHSRPIDDCVVSVHECRVCTIMVSCYYCGPFPIENLQWSNDDGVMSVINNHSWFGSEWIVNEFNDYPRLCHGSRRSSLLHESCSKYWVLGLVNCVVTTVMTVHNTWKWTCSASRVSLDNKPRFEYSYMLLEPSTINRAQKCLANFANQIVYREMSVPPFWGDSHFLSSFVVV